VLTNEQTAMPFDAQTVLFYARSTPQVSVLLDGKPSKWTAEEVPNWRRVP